MLPRTKTVSNPTEGSALLETGLLITLNNLTLWHSTLWINTIITVLKVLDYRTFRFSSQLYSSPKAKVYLSFSAIVYQTDRYPPLPRTVDCQLWVQEVETGAAHFDGNDHIVSIVSHVIKRGGIGRLRVSPAQALLIVTADLRIIKDRDKKKIVSSYPVLFEITAF